LIKRQWKKKVTLIKRLLLLENIKFPRFNAKYIPPCVLYQIYATIIVVNPDSIEGFVKSTMQQKFNSFDLKNHGNKLTGKFSYVPYETYGEVEINICNTLKNATSVVNV
jgi:hypothetical protein